MIPAMSSYVEPHGVLRSQMTPAVRLITLSRPPVNALTSGDYDTLAAELALAADDPAVRVTVLTGRGDRAFTAGTDRSSLNLAGPALDHSFSAARRFFAALAHHPHPLVAALNGPAVGGGAMIASQCDLVVARAGAYFAIPELGLGVPGGGSHLASFVPRPLLMQMMLLGERLAVEKAETMGLVHLVVSDFDLMGVTEQIAQQIADLDAPAVAAALRALRSPRELTLAGYLTEMAAMERHLRDRNP